MAPRELVLASTSPYRRDLLARLGLPFRTIAPDVDETPLPGEFPDRLVHRLAAAKARSVGPLCQGAIVIGSDQVAVLDGERIGKPGGHERAVEQLLRASGRRVEFLTGLAVLDTATDACQVDVVPFAVQFRPLHRPRIERYLARERPYDAAGSFKSEGLGVALFERMEGEDPTALIGLPLIRLTSMLAEAGLDVLGGDP
jgi:septum formation protein